MRNFTVFIDIEKLRAGKFDENLLESVRQAKNFILVLTQHALDRCMDDDDKKDWMHKVCDSKATADLLRILSFKKKKITYSLTFILEIMHFIIRI